MNTYESLTTEQIIELMESALNLKFSTEQLRILKNDYENPLLINACAGAGKTTIFILMILLAITKGIVDPQEVLGITFSNKSKSDIQARYQKYIQKLEDVGIVISLENIPKFTTFHSLFFQLLTTNEQYRSVEILSDRRQFANELKESIHYHDALRTDQELIGAFFRISDFLINKDLTDDGIIPRECENKAKSLVIEKINSYLRNRETDEFFEDYFTVMESYQKLKKENGLIDFNDMKMLLLKSVQDEKDLNQYRRIMQQYELVLIDEFQDIDLLQWRLISQLISSDSLNRIMMIGDDDQSVYSFRGSDPQYIMRYHDLLPQIKTLNLSVNYRTGGNILKAAVPMIEKNHIRIKKSLRALKSEQGKVVWENNDANDFQQLEDVIKKIRDPKIANDKIALLVRYNSSRTIAADFLANKNIYANLNNPKLVLQRNKSYLIIVELMRAFWTNRYKYFRAHTNSIGFRAYSNHVNALIEKYHKQRIVKLDNYLAIAEDNLNDLFRTESEMEAFDEEIISKYRTFAELKTRFDASLPQKLFAIIQELTNEYFTRMIGQNYLSSKDVQELFSYLEQELDCCDDLNEFFLNEDKKEKILTSELLLAQQKEQVQFLSLHQAKGLEFDYVYLIGINDKELKQDTVVINDYFPPTISFEQFVTKFDLFAAKDWDNLRIILKKAEIREFIEFHRDNKIEQVGLVNLRQDPRKLQAISELYQGVIKYSKFIEEERRLLYVGITRAKIELHLEIINNYNPLLKELYLT